MHLPLSPIDAANNPPESYLWVQDGLTLGCGILWGSAYILYTLQAYRDASYGMPMLALWANLGWETVYGLLYPPATAEFVAFFPFLVIDLYILHTTMKFGPREWQHAPLIAQNMKLITAVGLFIMLVAHWTLAKSFADLCEAGFWSGFICQSMISWSSMAQLLSRSSTRGHSLRIWWLRFMGTLMAVAVFQWRYIYYPVDYAYVRTPAANFLFIAPEFAELAYPFMFWYVANLENTRKGKNNP